MNNIKTNGYDNANILTYAYRYIHIKALHWLKKPSKTAHSLFETHVNTESKRFKQ